MASSSVGATGSSTSASTSSTGSVSAYDKLNVETFTKLLVAELQNQDPMSPMDSAQIIQQVAEIRSIQSNTELSDTLHAVLLGQNVATASSLIGRTIRGLTDDSKPITGAVNRVSIADGATKLYVGDSTVDLKNVSEILPNSGA